MNEQWIRSLRVSIRIVDDTALSCRQVAASLHPYLDGQLDAGTALRVAAHLEHCRRCHDEADGFRTLKQALQRQQAACDAQTVAQTVARLHEFGRRLCSGEPVAEAGAPDDAGTEPAIGFGRVCGVIRFRAEPRDLRDAPRRPNDRGFA